MADQSNQRGRLSDLSFHVLLALGDGVSHGYAVGKEVEDRSHGRLRPSTGALYQALKRLLDDDFVESAEAPADNQDARRRYYRLTSAGRGAVGSEAARLEELVEVARAKNLLAQP